MTKAKLRIGLLLDDNQRMSAWQHKMIKDILESDFAEVKLVILNETAMKQGNSSLLPKAQAELQASAIHRHRAPAQCPLLSFD